MSDPERQNKLREQWLTIYTKVEKNDKDGCKYSGMKWRTAMTQAMNLNKVSQYSLSHFTMRHVSKNGIAELTSPEAS